ncbi:MAG TPA: 23S rRNA (adenine(2503)-C(2))-methyltransferase RlmN [Myxococcota bacterium]|nr:23S rRNA (adenine(2503)-C(2))-methyltransferase RlmN [Myxococcota bacterium]
MKPLLALTPDELRAAFAAADVPAFRAAQVARWLYAQRVRDFGAMRNLPAPLRDRLAGEWSTRSLLREAVHDAADGTRKLVLGTVDGARIEAVLIPEERRRTLCVSSQVGCSLDCSFCATGRMGLGRNLHADEIVDQALHAAELLAEEGRALTHVVFMGMGEPLLNLRNVVQAIRVLTHPEAFALAPRRITVSTAGVAPKIAELGRALPVRLALSLHAARDELRDVLVPLNRRFPIAELLEACAAFPTPRRERLSFEYTLIAGVNDSLEDARALAALAAKARAKVNLIPLNEHPGTRYRRPGEARMEAFLAALAGLGVTATLRRARGDDIFAACGQLGARADARAAPPSPAHDFR